MSKRGRSPMAQRKAKQRQEAAYAAAVLGGCVIERWTSWRWGDGAPNGWKLKLPPTAKCDQVRYGSRYQAACAGIDYLTGKKEFREPSPMSITHGSYTGRQLRMLRPGVFGEEHDPIDTQILQKWCAEAAKNMEKLIYAGGDENVIVLDGGDKI